MTTATARKEARSTDQRDFADALDDSVPTPQVAAPTPRNKAYNDQYTAAVRFATQAAPVTGQILAACHALALAVVSAPSA